MKILLCKSHFAGPVSGADETLVAYATELAKLGHDVSVSVLFVRHGCTDPYSARLADAGIPVTTIAAFDPIGWPLRWIRAAAASAVRRFMTVAPGGPPAGFVRWLSYWTCAALYSAKCRAYVSSQGFEVVHVVTPDSGAAVLIRAAARAGVPVVYQELGDPRRQPNAFKSIVPHCTEVAALSPSLARMWAPTHRTCAPSVVPLIIEETGEVRTATPRGQGAAGVTFGFAGRLQPEKGVFALIEAFARVRQTRANARLVVAGSGRSRDAMIAMARSLGIADACRFERAYRGREGRAAFMRGIDVLVLPSLFEGTPNVILEAMAEGVPSIASNVGGIPDLVTADSGSLVPPGDTAALAKAMLRLTSSAAVRERLGRASRARFERQFAPGPVVRTLLEVYGRAVARGAVGVWNAPVRPARARVAVETPE